LPPLQLDGLDQQQQRLLQDWHREASQHAPIEHYCLVDVPELLRALSADMNRRRLKRGEKDKNKKDYIIPIAKQYFEEHKRYYYDRYDDQAQRYIVPASSRGRGGLFSSFAELFYEYVTGEKFFAPDKIKKLSDGQRYSTDALKYRLDPKRGNKSP
jgi:hypothetical protein